MVSLADEVTLMSANVPGANVLTEATGRQSVTEALAWIADEHPLERGTDLQELLRAVATHSGSTAEAERALRILARAVAASNLDSAAILFDPDTILPACNFRETLTRLATQCSGGTLAGITADAVIAAQREDSFTIEALCAVAGLSYKELAERVKDLPKSLRQ